MGPHEVGTMSLISERKVCGTHLRLVKRLRMRGAVPSLPYMPACRGYYTSTGKYLLYALLLNSPFQVITISGWQSTLKLQLCLQHGSPTRGPHAARQLALRGPRSHL